jgi:hypothetical protein
MSKTTRAQELINAARTAGGVLAFTTGAGTGNSLNTVTALRRAGQKVSRTGGEWQSKGGIQWLLTVV